jgi:hypothetical protein
MLIEAEGQAEASADELHHRNDTQEWGHEKQTGEDKDGCKGGVVASGGSCKGVGSRYGGDVVYRCKPTAARLYLCPFKTLRSSVKALLRRREQVQVLQQDVYACSCPRSARALTRICRTTVRAASL